MSSTGDPVQIVWTIQTDPDNSASLLALPIDDGALGVFLFTQREFADSFTAECPDIPAGAIVSKIEVPCLRDVLTEQAGLGRTHVVTDPILGSSSYLDQKTLTIDDYIANLPSQ